tara:strand:- start:34 stop:270 length:237 start_codon:yes stop_codon:yes gene_type:complete
MNTENNNLKLSDAVIGHVAKTLQVALITGTDIVDNLRLLEMTVEDGELVLTPECSENFENNLEEMLVNLPATDSPFSS